LGLRESEGGSLNIFIAFFLLSLSIPAYFLLIMADGRRLRTRMRYLAADLEDKLLDSEPRLITSDYPAWVSHSFDVSDEKVEIPDTDQICG
jgi:hypothetical protein